MLILLGFAFLSGLATILAPCIWPLLPIILSSSIGGRGRSRPLGVILGIMISFSVFTLAISWLVRTFNFDPNILRLIGAVVIGLLGLVMIVPALSVVWERLVSKLGNLVGRPASAPQNDFWGGLLAGLSLGLVWSPCAGPIFATIATLAATGQVSIYVVLLTIAYVVGVGIPLLVIAYGGQKLIVRSRALSPYTARIQQFFGVLMIFMAVAIYTNYDNVLQVKLLNVLPQWCTNGLAGLDQNSKVKEQLDLLSNKKPVAKVDEAALFNVNYLAPEFAGITKWLNTDKPLTLNELRGKVVLVDFWTYTCINCIRTLPYVTNWYDKYKDKGFVVVGVHTPEFEFEKTTSNVLSAISRFKINYPVAQDNNFATWNAYSNQYWPAEYLIDAKGNVRRVHFGEGEYDKTEEAIQALLKENGSDALGSVESWQGDSSGYRSPETYLGANRMEYYYPDNRLGVGPHTLKLSQTLVLNSFSLGGEWSIGEEDSTAGAGASLNYNFKARKVFLVMRPLLQAGAQNKVKVYLDEKLVVGQNAGVDVLAGNVTLDKDRLYELINLKDDSMPHLLRLEFSPGVRVFAFTFG